MVNVRILWESKYGIVLNFESQVGCSKLITEKFKYTSTLNPLKAATCRFFSTCNNNIRVFQRFVEGLRAVVVCVLGVMGEGCVGVLPPSKCHVL